MSKGLDFLLDNNFFSLKLEAPKVNLKMKTPALMFHQKPQPEQRTGFGYQYLMAFAANIGSLLLGCGMIYSAPVGPLLTDGSASIHLTHNENSLFSSSANIGAVFGGLISGYLMKTRGRRGTMILCSVALSAGWIILASAQNLSMLILGRVIHGICWGVLGSVVPTYVAEISHPSIRGQLGGLFNLGVASGLLYILAVGTFVKNFRFLALSALPLSILYFILMYFAVESPLYLALQGRDEEAKISILKLNGSSCNVSKEVERLRDLEERPEKVLSLKEKVLSLANPEAYKPLLLCLCLVIFHQNCGINGIAFNLLQIFMTSGISISHDVSMLLYSLIGIPGCLIAMFLVDRAGRKMMLLAGYIGTGLSHAGLATFFYLKTIDDQWEVWVMEKLWWLPVVGVCGFNFWLCIGTGAVVWLIIGEIFNPTYREVSASIATTVSWSTGFFVSYTFAPVNTYIGVYGPYTIYSISCFVAALFAVFILPETKGKTTEEITAIFKDKSSMQRKIIAEKDNPCFITDHFKEGFVV